MDKTSGLFDVLTGLHKPMALGSLGRMAEGSKAGRGLFAFLRGQPAKNHRWRRIIYQASRGLKDPGAYTGARASADLLADLAVARKARDPELIEAALKAFKADARKLRGETLRGYLSQGAGRTAMNRNVAGEAAILHTLLKRSPSLARTAMKGEIAATEVSNKLLNTLGRTAILQRLRTTPELRDKIRREGSSSLANLL